MKLRSLFTLTLVFGVFSVLAAQNAPKSPKAQLTALVGTDTVKVDYHSPQARGRKIMGELVPFGKVWRTGANNTTSIYFSGPMKLEGKDVAAGKYGLYTIPGEKEWTIILNKTIAWGSGSYDEKNDVLRVTVKPVKTAAFVEGFVIGWVKETGFFMEWENTRVPFNITK
jgi:hypothetical protein